MSPPRFRWSKKQNDTVSSPSDHGRARSNLPRFALPGSRLSGTFTSNVNSINDATDSIHEISSTQSASQDYHQPEHLDSDDEMLFDNYTETHVDPQTPGSRLAKRQKLSEDAEIQVTRKLPYSPRRHVNSLNRFVTSASGTVEKEDDATQIRPSFIVPSPSEEVIEAALPAIFSPQRSTRQLLPSGLASSLRSEIMELTSMRNGEMRAAIAPGTTLHILNIYPKFGFIAIEAEMPGDEPANILLFGNGHEPQEGQDITIKGINWSIEVEGIAWSVVLHWIVQA